MKIILETERLYLREFAHSDGSHFYYLNNDEDVVIKEGDSGDALFLIKQGKAKVTTVESGNKELVLAEGLEFRISSFPSLRLPSSVIRPPSPNYQLRTTNSLRPLL